VSEEPATPAVPAPGGAPAASPVPPEPSTELPTGATPYVLMMPPVAPDSAAIAWPGGSAAWAIPVSVPVGMRGYAVFVPLVEDAPAPRQDEERSQTRTAQTDPPPVASTTPPVAPTAPPVAPEPTAPAVPPVVPASSAPLPAARPIAAPPSQPFRPYSPNLPPPSFLER